MIERFEVGDFRITHDPRDGQLHVMGLGWPHNVKVTPVSGNVVIVSIDK